MTTDEPQTGRNPQLGEWVLYTLTGTDAERINRRRDGAANLNAAGVTLASQELGPQIHAGNTAEHGQVFPMLITRVWRDSYSGVNGQVFLDGNDVLWVTSRAHGEEPGRFHYRD